jgi:hypothetical protein
VVSSEAAEQNTTEPSIFFSPTTQDARNIDSPMEIIPEDRGQHAHSSRLEYIITTSVLDTSTHTDADEEIFDIPSTRRMELLGILSQTIGHVDVPVPFWATLIPTDIDMPEIFVDLFFSLPNPFFRNSEIGLYFQFLHACMHSFTSCLEAEGAETTVLIGAGR